MGSIKGEIWGVGKLLEKHGKSLGWAVPKWLNRWSRCHLGAWLLWAHKFIIRWGQGQTNPFAAERADNSAIRPFVKILWPLATIHAKESLEVHTVFVMTSNLWRDKWPSVQIWHSANDYTMTSCTTHRSSYPDFSGYECSISNICDNQNGARVTKYWRCKVWRCSSYISYMAVDSSKLIGTALRHICISSFSHCSTAV